MAGSRSIKDLKALDEVTYGAGVLLLRGRNLILQQRSVTESEPLTWVCFGGMADNGEAPRRAAQRELREESGVEVPSSDLALLDVLEYPGENFRFFVYLCDDFMGQDIVLSEESHIYGEFPLGDDTEKLWENLPRPLHSGMTALIAKPSVSTMMLETLSRTIKP